MTAVDRFNRVVVTLLGMGLLAGGGLALAAAGGGVGPELQQRLPALAWVAEAFRTSPEARFHATAGAALAAVAGLALLLVELRGAGGPPALLLQKDSLGAVTVSLHGLRRLAEHVVGEIAGVRHVASEARRTRKGIAFRCRVAVDPSVSAPELATAIRERLAAALQGHLGQPPALTRIEIHTHVGARAAAERRRLR